MPTATPPAAESVITRWKSADPCADAGDAGEPPFPHPAGDASGAAELIEASRAAGAEGIPTTTYPCLVIVSGALSCGRCDSSVWKGTCGALSVGCCPAPPA